MYVKLQSCRKVLRLLLCWLFDMIHRRLWLAINFSKTAFLTDFGYHYISRSISPCRFYVCPCYTSTLMARNIPRGRETVKARKFLSFCWRRRLSHAGNGGKIGSAHGKLFPSAVIFFCWYPAHCNELERTFLWEVFPLSVLPSQTRLLCHNHQVL